MSKKSIEVSVREATIKLSKKQKENFTACQKFYTQMKNLGLTKKEEFEGDLPYLTQESFLTKHLTYFSDNNPFRE